MTALYYLNTMTTKCTVLKHDVLYQYYFVLIKLQFTLVSVLMIVYSIIFQH